MNISRIVIVGMLLVASTRAFSQTGMIAHRSHGGSVESFVAVGEDNFGLPPKHVDSVARITDTSTVEFSSYGVDTVYNGRGWNNPKPRLDSLRRAFPKIKFIDLRKPRKRTHARDLSMPERRIDVTVAPETASRQNGISMLAILCSVAVPSLAYGIWRAEKRPNG